MFVFQDIAALVVVELLKFTLTVEGKLIEVASVPFDTLISDSGETESIFGNGTSPTATLTCALTSFGFEMLGSAIVKVPVKA